MKNPKHLLWIVTIGFIALLWVSTSMAAEWKFYGHARMTTFYQDEKINDKHDASTRWDLQSNARIGATAKNDNIGGCFEYGSAPNLRRLFGTWNFGAGELKVGQDYTPSYYAISSQAYNDDDGLLNYGQAYIGRQPMLQVSMSGAKIALIKPKSSDLGTKGDVDSLFPKLEACYELAVNNLKVIPFLGYQYYSIETPKKDLDVNAFLVGSHLELKTGPAYIKGTAYFSTNADQFGLSGKGARSAVVVNDDVKDCNSYGVAGVFGFKATDTMTVETGAGYQSHELDTKGSDPDDTLCVYAQAKIDLATGVFIVPEVGYIDYLDNNKGDDEKSSCIYGGAKWEIRF
ncbi:MAG: hypothetical protein HQK77_00815 [Desulfobacterales bacterium]|nr:hypothetical protein [Desulfobacterales bacterium]